jgi:S-DNA-T family DNA segregation ATPase FtsK/SpoIIIE
MPSLLVVAGPNEGDCYLVGRRTLVVGRDEACPIQIVDELVSRKHLQIRLEPADERYRVLDLKSANGVYVNSQRITGESVLADQDIIGLGNSTLLFSQEEISDTQTALKRYHQRGERGRSTLIRDKDE